MSITRAENRIRKNALRIARIEWILETISDMEATVEVIATDEDTVLPGTTTVYERYDGSQYMIYKAGINETRKDIKNIYDVESNYLRGYPGSERLRATRKAVRTMQAELKKLEKLIK